MLRLFQKADMTCSEDELILIPEKCSMHSDTPHPRSISSRSHAGKQPPIPAMPRLPPPCHSPSV